MSYDHDAPCHGVLSAENYAKVKRFAKKWGIHWFEQGQHGIVHQLAAETGRHRPGEIFLYQDSHTTAAGALNCAGKGVGELEMAYILAKGETIFPVNECIKFSINGKLQNRVHPRDIILSITGTYGNFVNKNIEFMGDTIDDMSIDGRQCITTASTELSIDFPLMKADQHVIDYVTKRTSYGSFTPVEPDHDAEYADEYLDKIITKTIPQEKLKLEYISGSYGCSSAKIDHMIDIALSVKGVAGAQIAGAGLGGCIMVLIKKEFYEDLQKALVEKYYQPAELDPEVFLCNPARGSSMIAY